MRAISLNARLVNDAQSTDEVEVLLCRITHPDLPSPVLLSTDPTERLSLEPLTYGTRSTWQGSGSTLTYQFVLVEAILPDENDDAPANASLVLEVLDSRIVEILVSTIQRAAVSMAVVMASSPDVVEMEYLGLKLVNAQFDAGQVALSFTMEPIYDEPYPSARMTKDRFPGLHQ